MGRNRTGLNGQERSDCRAAFVRGFRGDDWIGPGLGPEAVTVVLMLVVGPVPCRRAILSLPAGLGSGTEQGPFAWGKSTSRCEAGDRQDQLRRWWCANRSAEISWFMLVVVGEM